MTAELLSVDAQMATRRDVRFDLALGAALGLVSLLLYIRTLAPDVVAADGGEFQFAAWNFSIVHPTGYPLYLLVGGAFQHLVPFGNPAFRLNLFTALTAAAAVGVLYLVIVEIAHHRAAAAIAAAAFGLTRIFWFDASAAEVYDLNALFLALLILIALRWQSRPSTKLFALWCLVFGLALTHHRTILLWLPAFVLFVLVCHDKLSALRTWRHGLLLAVVALAPLLLYLYVPLRVPASPYGTLALAPDRNIVLYDISPGGLLDYVLGRGFQFEIGWDATSAARIFAVPQMMLDQFGPVGSILAIVGLAVMAWRKELAMLVLFVGGAAITVVFASIYHIGDIQHYYIPVFLVWAVWIGVGLAAVFRTGVVGGSVIARRAVHAALFSGMHRTTKQSSPDPKGPRPTREIASPTPLAMTVTVVIAVLAAVLIPGLQFANNFKYADRSTENPREMWSRLLASNIPQDAILLSNDRDDMMPLWYFQYVEHTRPDILGLFPLLTPASGYADIGRLTDTALSSGRPVFLIKPMPGLEVKYRLAAKEGGMMRVLGRLEAPVNTVNGLRVGDLEAVGYSTKLETEGMRVSIYWRPVKRLGTDYVAFVHLLAPDNTKVAQGNDHKLGGDYYPTSLWQVGETLRDEQVIRLPEHQEPASYKLLAGMYSAADGEALGEPVVVGTVDLP